ncbi:hypothetical protein DN752_09900 [Echinicola strongylocentroti]|uniref:Uncharacterized protein n=1 Tax=Echinicola strongylocentroti TaxID=1795355 RepID=A0A2Z4IIQ7_9BACT|nr:hypothetical protein [Echinicola strongylocentroti]AWW30408.1 hypothetical protein DN752_09900 [Echinicola strongylocentroti]
MEYNPVNSSYHDRLEAWSIMGTECDITYIKNGKETSVHSKVIGVLNVKDGEYIFGENGLAIRMDSLVAINGVSAKKEAVGK